MTQSRDTINAHELLISKLHELGYNADPKGVCLGIACMAMQAMLVGELDNFDERLRLIYETENLPRQLRRIHRKLTSHSPRFFSAPNQRKDLSPRQKKLFETYPFMDGVIVYQHSFDYPHLFTDTLLPRIEKVATLLASNKLQEKGGLAKLDVISGIYTQQELHSYFRSFRKNIIRKKIISPIVLVLTSASHAITLQYDALEHQWLLIDANEKGVLKFNTDSQLVSAIQKALLMINAFSFTALTLTSEIFSCGENKKRATRAIKSWQRTKTFIDLHTITAEKAIRTDSVSEYTWLHAALYQHQLDVASQLILQGANVNHVDNWSKASPLYIASVNGHENLIELMLQHHNVDIDQLTEKGTTTLYIAVQCQYIEIVKLLLDHKANPNIPSTDTFATPLMVAIENDNIELVKLLLKFHANPLYIRLSDGKTPISIAEEHGNHKIIACLKKAARSKKALKHRNDPTAILDDSNSLNVRP